MFLKKYLSRKKTHQTLYTTWRKMEAAIRDRLMNIKVSALKNCGLTLLTLNRKLFQLVFSVIT